MSEKRFNMNLTKEDVLKMTREELYKARGELIREVDNVSCSYCIDCTHCPDCTHCIDCTDCLCCLRCVHCIDCSRCLYCVDCIDCIDCLYCANLRGGKYMICNVQLGEKEYEAKIKGLKK